VPSNAVTPRTVPGMPTTVSASAGFASAQVSFAAPTSNGGSPILSYSARCTSSDGGVAGSASELASPVTVTGLSNGKSYSCTVAAANAAGNGPDSASSGAVVPQATVIAPGAPEDVSAGVGNQQASVSFSAPASDGGATITAYTVTSSPGGVTASGAVSPLTLTGLINGVAYTFSVTATNSVGAGLASVPSNAVTPRTVPGMPTTVSASAGFASAQVSFAAPTSNGGSPILSYSARCTSSNGGVAGSASEDASPVTVAGLSNGKSYSCTVAATNAAGTGPISQASTNFTLATELEPQPIPSTNHGGLVLLGLLMGLLAKQRLKFRTR